MKSVQTQASLREGGGPRQRWKEPAQLQFSTNFTKWIPMKSYTLSFGKIFLNEPAPSPLMYYIKYHNKTNMHK